MNYELAKELEQLGFPKVGIQEFRYGMSEEVIYYPRLSDLIEACGSKFGALMVGPGLSLWTVRGNGVEIHAESPIEAVARLWLALNKKV